MTPKPSLLCNGTTIHSHIQAQILEIILKVSFSSSLLPMTYGHIVSIQTSGCLSNPSMSPYSSLVCATIILHTNNFNNITTSSPTYVSFNPFFIKQLSFYNTYLLQLIHSLNSPQFLFNILQKKKKWTFNWALCNTVPVYSSNLYFSLLCSNHVGHTLLLCGGPLVQGLCFLRCSYIHASYMLIH